MDEVSGPSLRLIPFVTILICEKPHGAVSCLTLLHAQFRTETEVVKLLAKACHVVVSSLLELVNGGGAG